MYETFEHTADLGLRIIANDLETLFAEAGQGLFSIIVADLSQVRPQEQLSITVTGEMSEMLLFDWLNELLYLYETKRLLLSQFEVRLSPTGLTATVWGEPIDRDRHVLDHEVKAITYHELKLRHEGDSWLAEVIVDI